MPNDPAGRNQEQRSLKLILWCMAAEPIILAAVGYLMIRERFPSSLKLDPSLSHILIIFAAVSLIMVWIGSQFASGRFRPRTDRPATPQEPLPPGHHIIALALFTIPGVLGLVYYLLFGTLWVLGVFNLGSSLLAAYHILYRMET